MKKNLLHLGEIIKRDKIEYGSNNLIISPTGSGKTYHMLNDLRKQYTGKTLMLVSTSSLKDALSELEGTYTTQDIIKDKMGVRDKGVYLMSYAEFGHNVKWNDRLINQFELILCDEIHSLFEYYSYERSHNLGVAIEKLFRKYEGKTIFYYTATTSRIEDFMDTTYSDLFENIRVFDYSKNNDILRYFNDARKDITSIDDLDDLLISIDEMKGRKDYKGFIYNERISGMIRIGEKLRKLGYSAIEIWSVNNSKYPMNDEQLMARDELLTKNRIPDKYDFIIINGSMREGWELKDERVKVGILNTLDETDRVQARGRYRGDLSLLVTRVEGDNTPIDVTIVNKEKNMLIIESVLGKELDSADKDEIVEKFNVRNNETNRQVKWTTISKTLRKNGYEIKDGTVRRDGKRVRVQTITRMRVPIRPSAKSKSQVFLSKLGRTEFAKVNKDLLNNYINKGSGVAHSHIKSSYELFTGSEMWDERRFADITYLIARDGKLFCEEDYREYGRRYLGTDKTEILIERAKYEKGAVIELEEARAEEVKAEEDLLKYLEAHGGLLND